MAKKMKTAFVKDFHDELSDLLNKYNLFPDDGKILLATSQMTFRADDIRDCKPECIMRTPVKHPNGTTTYDVWCGC